MAVKIIPIIGCEMDRAIELCNHLPTKLHNLQHEIAKVISDLFIQDKFLGQLQEIVQDLDELNYLLIELINSNPLNTARLERAVFIIKDIPHNFIIVSHYINPEYKYTRLVRKSVLIKEILKAIDKINLVSYSLKCINQGERRRKNFDTDNKLK